MPPLVKYLLTFLKPFFIVFFAFGLLACNVTQQQSGLASEQAVPLPKAVDFFTDTLNDGSHGPAMVSLPAYYFKRGCMVKGDCYDDSKPVRTVTIGSGIALSTREITFEEYDKFVAATNAEAPDDMGWGRDTRPVINVTWDDATAYADWLSKQTGHNYQLPTEAVWEYAARAGSSSFYSFGNEAARLCEFANVADISEARRRNGKPLVNCDDGYGKGTAPVASFKANAFGIYDMSGNVREWVQDCYHDNYRNAPVDGTARQDSCDTEDKVLRGGAWFSFPWINSSSTRQNAAPYTASFSIGFRLMRLDSQAE